MKQLLSLVLVCLPSSCLLAQDAKPVKYVVVSPKIEIEFPGKPKESKVAGGKQVLFATPDQMSVYLFQYTKFPKEAPIQDDPALAKKILDGMRDGAVNSQKNGKLLSEKDFVYNKKLPGRIVVFEAPGIGIYKSHFIISPNYLYMSMVGGTQEFTTSKDAGRFFESLKIGE